MLGLPNPYLILAAFLTFSAALGGAYLKGRSDGVDVNLAAQVDAYKLALEAQNAYANGLTKKLSDSANQYAKLRSSTEKRVKDYEAALARDPDVATWDTTRLPDFIVSRLCEYRADCNPVPDSPGNVHGPAADP